MKVQSNKGFAHPVLLLVAVLTVAGVGFAGYRVLNANNDNQQLNSSEIQASEDRVLPDNLDGILTYESVKEIALQDTEATISGLELENEDGVLVYKIELSDGTVKYINAQTGESVMDMDDDDMSEIDETEDDDVLPANFTINISFEEARRIAKAEFPDSKVSKIELDVEAGVVVLSVRFIDDARVDVNVETGDIVRTKAPRSDEDERREDNDDSNDSDSDSDDDSDSGSDDSDDDNSNSGSDNSGSDDDDNEIRVEGILTNSNGVYSVTVNGTIYTVESSQDIANLVGQKVRVEGALQAGNVIRAEKVDER